MNDEERIDHAMLAMHMLGVADASERDLPTQANWLLAGQIHATLALVEQQRIANILALTRIESENSSTPTDALDYLYDREEFDLGGKLVTNPSIVDGLGLS